MIRPRRWAAFSTWRGIVGPFTDRRIERDQRFGDLIGAFEARVENPAAEAPPAPMAEQS